MSRLDLRVRLDSKTSKLLSDIREKFNLTSWTETVRVAIKISHSTLDKKEEAKDALPQVKSLATEEEEALV